MSGDTEEQVEKYGLTDKLDEAMINIVTKYTHHYYARQGLAHRVSWTEEDLTNEVILIFLGQAKRGTLPERFTRELLNSRTIDAMRKLGKNTRSGDAHPHIPWEDQENGEETSIVDQHLRQRVEAGRISIVEQVEGYTDPQNTAEELRKIFEEEGCLWTAKFHAAVLELTQANAVTAAARRKGTAGDAIVEWFTLNPGSGPPQSLIAEQLELTRETVTRNIVKLLTDKRIRRETNPNSSKRGQGRWCYFPVRED